MRHIKKKNKPTKKLPKKPKVIIIGAPTSEAKMMLKYAWELIDSSRLH